MNETGRGGIPVPELSCKAAVQEYGNFISAICISDGPDPFIASASWDCAVLVHDLKTLRLIATLRSPVGEIISDVCVCRRMGVCCAVASFSMDGKIRVFDGLKGWEMSHCFDHSSRASLSSVIGAVKLVILDRLYCVSGGVDKIIRVRDLSNPKTIIHSLRGHTGGIKCVDVTERGLIASGSDDNTVKLWDLFNGKFLRTLRGHMLEINAIVFIKESTWLVTGSEDKVFRVWDTTEGTRLRIFKGYSGPTITSLACIYSPGVCPPLVIVGGTEREDSVTSVIEVWRLDTGDLIGRCNGHRGEVAAIAAYIDVNEGDVTCEVATGGIDKTMRLWDFTSYLAEVLPTFEMIEEESESEEDTTTAGGTAALDDDDDEDEETGSYL